MAQAPRVSPLLVCVALAVLAAGALVLWFASQIPVAAMYARIGPRAFPYAVGALLLGMGVLLLLDALRGRWHCEATDPEERDLDFVPLMWVGAGLLANLVLIKPIGFVLASTAMYVLVAKGFGAKRWWFAGLVGFVLALVAYLGFAQGLGLRMGGGLIEDLF